MNRNRRPRLFKAALMSLFGLSAIAPCTASAKVGPHTNQAYEWTLCYPTPNDCVTKRQPDSGFWDTLTSAGMPADITDECEYGSEPHCKPSDAQYWYYTWTDGSSTSWYYVPSPGSGGPSFLNANGNLVVSCLEQSESEDYLCSTGTGGPGFSWQLSVKY